MATVIYFVVNAVVLVVVYVFGYTRGYQEGTKAFSHIKKLFVTHVENREVL